MDDAGKVDRSFFEEVIYPRLGADRADVRLGPRHGADFGVIEVGDRVVALATDPVWLLTELGPERAARFAFHVLVGDVALSGLPPSHLSIDLNLPLDATRETFEAVWRTFDREARDLGVAITTGHTGRYEGCAFPTVGGGTAIAVGDPADLVLPTGATPGDRLVVTKGPAIETTGILGLRFGDHLDLPTDALAAARERFDETSPVRDAMVASAAGPVTAMHDATERGLWGALHELAHAGGVRLSVERDRVPVGAGVREVCDRFDVDPWTASSSGTVLLTVESGGVETVLDALDSADIRAAEVGAVLERDGGGSGTRRGPPVEVDGEALAEPESDPFWSAYRRAVEEFEVRREMS